MARRYFEYFGIYKNLNSGPFKEHGIIFRKQNNEKFYIKRNLSERPSKGSRPLVPFNRNFIHRRPVIEKSLSITHSRKGEL